MSCYSNCYSMYDTMLHIPHFHNHNIPTTQHELCFAYYTIHTMLYILYYTYFTQSTTCLLHMLCCPTCITNAILHTAYAVLLNVPQCTYSTTHTSQNNATLCILNHTYYILHAVLTLTCCTQCTTRSALCIEHDAYCTVHTMNTL